MVETNIQLKVAEARGQDVGRGIARIDPVVMERLGIEVGEVIKVSGKRETVARVMPTFAEDRDQGLIKIDGVTRENSKTSLDEKVKITKVTAASAEKLILTPLTTTLVEEASYLGKLLSGVPVVRGDRVRVTLLGTRFQDFLVGETAPSGPVLIGEETEIILKGKGKRAEAKVSYEDIGGLGKEVQRIREMIELPLKHPELFERLGIDPPKGVLLYGPPGCGKTLIARALSNESEASFFQLSGPEVMHKFYGESEGHLRELFEEAKSHAPSIVFLDELDAIAPKREELGGEKQVERRVVAQLLALMDGLESRGQVIVIGATNIPNTLDPALRRPGRFDREIAIRIPDKNGRLEILQIYTRGMPLSEDVSLEKLASITHGFVGADLEALAREAAMVTLRKIMPKVDLESAYIPYEILLELQVTRDDFFEALKEVEPSAIREVFTEIPEVSWDDVGGLEEVKRTLKEAVEWPLHYPELFAKSKTTPPKGILLTGATGTGKTLLAKALANESGVNFIAVSGPALLSRFVGESERGVREVFKKAKQAAPCVVCFDEIEGLVPKRGMVQGDSGVSNRVVSQFLSEMDGIEELKGVVIVGTTNRPDLVDSALLRPGRFDFILELPTPDKKARLAILKIHTKGKPLASDVDLTELATLTEDLAGAEIESLCQKASLMSIRDFVAVKSTKSPRDLDKFKINFGHFKKALSQMKRRK